MGLIRGGCPYDALSKPNTQALSLTGAPFFSLVPMYRVGVNEVADPPHAPNSKGVRSY